MDLEKLTNPRNLKHPVATGVVIGAVGAYAAGVCITDWLHRSTHRGVEFGEGAKKFWRGANLVFTGMPKADWVDHIVHHAKPDQEDWDGLNDWNTNRPEGAPEAPIEAFRDPYSCALEGYSKVLFNTPGLHRRAKTAINPFLQKLQAFDEQNDINDRNHWPEHLRNVDMDEANPDAFRNKYPYAGLVALGGINAVLFGPLTAAVASGVHIGAMFGMAGDINAINHTGQKKGFWNRLKVLAGKEQPIPDEKGEYAADLAEGWESIVLGEKRHKYHHDNPQDPFISGESARRDLGGLVIKFMEKHGWASTPGAKVS